MALESATHIQDLVSTNPQGSDQKAQGDDHIRLIKEVLKRDFPDVTGIVRFLGWNAKTDAVQAKTTNYTLTATDDGQLITFTLSGAATLTIPSASLVANNGYVVWVRKDSSESTLTIASAGSETVNGLTSVVLGAYDSGMLWSDGTAWHYLGSSMTLFSRERTIRRAVNDAALQDGLILERTRSGTAADNDFGTSIVAKHQDDAGNSDVVGRLAWRMLDTGNGSEDMAWFFENIIGGSIASADRLWKGQGLYADGLTDPGSKGVNFARYDISNDQIFPLTALSQLTAANIAVDDRVLIRDTSAGDHLYAVAKDLGGWCVLEEQTASASSALDFNLTSYLTNFEDFEFILSNLRVTTDAQHLWLRTDSDAGASVDAGASDYAWDFIFHLPGALSADFDAADAQISLTGSTAGQTMSNVAGECLSGVVKVYNPAAALPCQITWDVSYHSSGGDLMQGRGTGRRLTSADVDFIRFLAQSGTLASGKITLMGRRKAA